MSFFVPEKNSRLAKELVEILSRTDQNIPNELRTMSYQGGGGGRGRRGRY